MDFDRYVGLPWREGGRSWSGIDCYGLVWLFYRHEKGIDLPDYAEAYDAFDTGFVAGAIMGNLPNWREVDPVPGCVVLMLRGSEPAHVGILAPRRHLLHIDAVVGSSAMVRITDDIKRRIVGYFLLRDEP